MSDNAKKERGFKKLFILAVTGFVGYQLFLLILAFFQIHNTLQQDYFVYSHVEESHMKVQQIEVKYPLAGHKDRKVDGRLTGRACEYYAIGYDLKDSTGIRINLPFPRHIDKDKISYATKYDSIFPFLLHNEVIRVKKSRRGLATTSYVVAMDSLLPIWRPKNPALNDWDFRYAKDEKANWYKKWGEQLLYLLLILAVLSYFWRRMSKSTK